MARLALPAALWLAHTPVNAGLLLRVARKLKKVCQEEDNRREGAVCPKNLRGKRCCSLNNTIQRAAVSEAAQLLSMVHASNAGRETRIHTHCTSQPSHCHCGGAPLELDSVNGHPTVSWAIKLSGHRRLESPPSGPLSACTPAPPLPSSVNDASDSLLSVCCCCCSSSSSLSSATSSGSAPYSCRPGGAGRHRVRHLGPCNHPAGQGHAT